jgi:hypothetical protein
MPDLLENLVPMPLVISSEMPTSLDADALFVTEPWVRFQPEPVVHEEKRAPWEDWDEWDFRAWMEKRRQQERWEADFARRQADVRISALYSYLWSYRVSTTCYPPRSRTCDHACVVFFSDHVS